MTIKDFTSTTDLKRFAKIPLKPNNRLKSEESGFFKIQRDSWKSRQSRKFVNKTFINFLENDDDDCQLKMSMNRGSNPVETFESALMYSDQQNSTM